MGDGARAIDAALDRVLRDGVRTPDLGGASTTEVAEAVLASL